MEGRLDPFRETLLPAGTLELMVNLGPSHRLIGHDGAATTWDRSWFYGLHERSLVIASDRGTHLVSARLPALGAADLLGACVPASANQVVDLESLFGADARRLRTALLAADGAADRFALLEEWLLGRRAPPDVPAPDFVRRAAAMIDEAHGNLPVSRLYADVGVSRKHLAVAFRRHLGVPAKSYARIRRFAWTLERLRETEDPDWPRLAGEAGYSDQSHLVRDFRRIGAASPTDYLRRRAPGGTALFEDDAR